VAVPQGVDQPFADRTVPRLPDAHGVGDGRRNEVGRRDRRQVHEGDAVGESGSHLLGDPQRQPGLARPARAGERNEADAVPPHQVGDGRNFALAADEGGQRGRRGG
jgi:hypothetical protein